MIIITVLYPFSENKKFDWDYYLNYTLPAVFELYNSYNLKIKFLAIKGVSGLNPDRLPLFFCTAHIEFENMEEVLVYKKMFSEHSERIDDIANFTDVQPIIQISNAVEYHPAPENFDGFVWSTFYPSGQDKYFNMDYYTGPHHELAQEKIGHIGKGMIIEQGLSSVTEDSSPSYFTITHVFFDNLESLIRELPNLGSLKEDIPNYTDTKPVGQLGKIMVQRERK